MRQNCFPLIVAVSLVIIVILVFISPDNLHYPTSDVPYSEGLRRNLMNNRSLTDSTSPAVAGVAPGGCTPQWGNKFSRNLVSTFPSMDCIFYRRPICCSALETPPPSTTNLKQKHDHCVIKKEYLPSPYEVRHLRKAEELAEITDLKHRTEKFIEFVESSAEVEHAQKWLERIKIRQTNLNVVENAVDREYLSRFKVIQKCQNKPDTFWLEYIEPLSVHARHPFGLTQCRNPLFDVKRFIYNRKVGYVSYLSVDYLLLQSHHDLNGHLPHRFFLLDAGTSRFDSSLYWFVCAYQQLGFFLDRIFGWEYTLLEPVEFWEHVPQRYLGSYTFFNAPISADINAHQSPLRLIKQIAQPNDFVSFKLDVDTPEVEIPIVLEMLNNTEMHSLIDEFFFELHFRCEVMMSCGWFHDIPESFHGLRLDRPSALKLFRDLRKFGIRAHIWP